MAKLILFNLITVDGYFTGPDGDISWHNAENEEFGEFAVEHTRSAEAIIFGRVTYEMMAGFWPTTGVKAEPETAEIMNSIPKYVFSRTLKSADWSNTTLINEDAAEAMPALKEKHTGDLMIFGSANLAASLSRPRLIDEYRLLVNPIVLGEGVPHFPPGERIDLDLLDVRRFESGNVLLTYAPKGATA